MTTALLTPGNPDYSYSLVSADTSNGILNDTKRFLSIILYENGHLKKSVYERMYPFWKERRYYPYTCSSSQQINGNALCIGLFASFALVMQLIFITVNHPFRWISLSFLLFAVVIHVLYFCVHRYYAEKQCCINFVLQWFQIQSEHDYTPLIQKCAPSVITNVFAIYPHIILLTFFILFNDTTTISYVSYLASFLSISAFYAVLCSTFLYCDTIILNVCWSLLDFCAMLFLLFSLFYDNTTMIVILIDLCLSFAAYAYIMSVVYTLRITNCALNVIGNIFAMLISLILFPIMYTMNMLPLFTIDQYLRWCIIPITNDTVCNNADWCRYLLHEWITNAPNEKETTHRLCCANMVIMELDSVEEEPKYWKLTENLKVVLDDYLADFEDRKEILTHCRLKMSRYQIILYGYIAIKAVHCITCAFVITYVGFGAVFDGDASISINILFIFILVLVIATAAMICISIRSKHYKYALLSFNDATSIDDIRHSIACCDAALQTLKVLADIMGDSVARIVFQYIRNKNKNNVALKHKVLILGAAFSGKSTILKQLRLLYGHPFTESELIAVKPHLAQNTIEAIRTLAIFSEIYADRGKDTRVCDENQEIRSRVALMSDKTLLCREHYDDFERLWTDPQLRNVLHYKHQFQLAESMPYLMEKMDDYCKDEYIPTFEDHLRSRQRTTGVNKISFKVESEFELEASAFIYDVFDVGGVKNERRKWMHFFDNISAVFFCASLAGYNEVLWEDSSTNRLKEAIGLFRALVNLEQHFENASIIIWLTHYDRFREKIGKHPVKEFFADFTGHETEYEIIEFVKQKFRDQIHVNENGHKRRVYFCIGSSIDTSWVDATFHSCRNIIE